MTDSQTPLGETSVDQCATREEAVRTVYSRIPRYLAGQGVDRATIDDVTQEVALKVYLHHDTIDHLTGFAFRVAKNALCDRLRETGRVVPTSDVLDQPGPWAERFHDDDFADPGVLEDAKLFCDEHLTPKQRAVFELVLVEGMPAEEVAGLLEISVSTVRSHLSNGIARLQPHRDEAHRRLRPE